MDRTEHPALSAVAEGLCVSLPDGSGGGDEEKIREDSRMTECDPGPLRPGPDP